MSDSIDLLAVRVQLGVDYCRHRGHDGQPGATDGVLCLRCQADIALDTLADRAEKAEAALAEIEAKPYRAEEVTARYRRETL